MERRVIKYIAYLEHERHYSPHTTTAYADDLRNFSSFLIRHFGTSSIPWKDVDHLTIRLFLGDLLEHGYSIKSATRKLAAIR